MTYKPPLRVSTAIGADTGEINAHCVTIETPAGSFQFGMDNYGQPYVGVLDGMLLLAPSSSNRAVVIQTRRVPIERAKDE